MCKSVRLNRHLYILVLMITLLYVLSCEDIPETTTRCELDVFVTLVNSLNHGINVSFVDSTQWDLLSSDLVSKDVSLPQSTIALAGKSTYSDSIYITWQFEHDDIYEEVEPCSAEVDLNVFSVIFTSPDTIISEVNLNLNCSRSYLDTVFTDSTGVQVARFSYTTSVFIDSTGVIP